MNSFRLMDERLYNEEVMNWWRQAIASYSLHCLQSNSIYWEKYTIMIYQIARWKLDKYNSSAAYNYKKRINLKSIVIFIWVSCVLGRCKDLEVWRCIVLNFEMLGYSELGRRGGERGSVTLRSKFLYFKLLSNDAGSHSLHLLAVIHCTCWQSFTSLAGSHSLHLLVVIHFTCW